jgi:hypothetical protein
MRGTRDALAATTNLPYYRAVNTHVGMTASTQPLSGAVSCEFPHTIDLSSTLVAVNCHRYPAKFSPYPLIFTPIQLSR